MAIGVDLALFLFLFTRLPKVASPFRKITRGALLAALGFEVLKTTGSLLVKAATHNPVYGTFAVVVGLLIWLNYLSRFTLFVAAWTVTAPYDSDVRPSGTADAEMAESAGIPVEFSSEDPDKVATTAGGGAPSPLREALSRRPEPGGAGPGASPPSAPAVPRPVRAAVPAPAGALERAKAAGYVVVGVLAAGTVGVVCHGLRVARDLVRRG